MAVCRISMVGDITLRREIECVVRDGKIKGSKLKLRNDAHGRERAGFNHSVEETIDLR
jgi:hypothetical protein